MTFEEFVRRTIDIPTDCREPFCPFGFPAVCYCYCDAAYSSSCYICINAKEAYSKNPQLH